MGHRDLILLFDSNLLVMYYKEIMNCYANKNHPSTT